MLIKFTPDTVWQILGSEYAPVILDSSNYRLLGHFQHIDIEALKKGAQSLSVTLARDGSPNLASTQEGYAKYGTIRSTMEWDTSKIKYNSKEDVFEVDVDPLWVINETWREFPGLVVGLTRTSFPGHEGSRESHLRLLFDFCRQHGAIVKKSFLKEQGSAWEQYSFLMTEYGFETL